VFLSALSKLLKGLLAALSVLPLVILWSGDSSIATKVIGTLLLFGLAALLGIALAKRSARHDRGLLK